jgi:hypothetical protein
MTTTTTTYFRGLLLTGTNLGDTIEVELDDRVELAEHLAELPGYDHWASTPGDAALLTMARGAWADDFESELHDAQRRGLREYP